jgi:MHS family alpha-ketoglutarate permease-like MFS transporter
MMSLQGVSDPLIAGALIMVSLTVISFYTSVGGIVKAEMFPVEVRALGVGLSYAIGNALFGGSAEYVALGLKSLGSESAFYWYVTAMMVVAALISLRLPRQPTYLTDDH